MFTVRIAVIKGGVTVIKRGIPVILVLGKDHSDQERGHSDQERDPSDPCSQEGL